MGALTTHILDTAHGIPGAGIAIDLYRVTDTGRQHIRAMETNNDGRCDSPLLEGEEFISGNYELEFHMADYFKAKDIDLPEPTFLDTIIIRFGIADEEEHYHVPLLVSPWSYSTYRGS